MSLSKLKVILGNWGGILFVPTINAGRLKKFYLYQDFVKHDMFGINRFRRV
jgi:hypothetical protein